MVHFNTFNYIEKLVQAGFSKDQAKTFAEVQENSLSEAMDSTLATKIDIQTVNDNLNNKILVVNEKIQTLDHKIDLVESRLTQKIIEQQGETKLLKWMIGVVMTGVMALILKAFF